MSVIVLVSVVSFVVTFFLTRILSEKLRGAGIVGKDVHKEDQRAIPEMGGLALLFGFSAGLFVAIPFVRGEMIFLFAAFIVVLLTGIIGIADDLFGIRQKRKAFLPIFAAVPLMATQAGVHSMILPFLGLVNFGILYPLFIIPLAVTVASNSVNMLAGYNGLEAGLGAIACGFLGGAGLMLGRPEVAVLMFSMAAACVGFLRFNYYPARIFMGDVGTFTIGSAIAAAAIIGNMETIGLLVLGPYILNGGITVLDMMRGKRIQKFSTVRDGVLVPPSTEYVYTLYFALEKAMSLNEKKLVRIIWAIGIGFGILALLFANANR